MLQANYSLEVKEHAMKQIRDAFLYYESLALGLGEKILQSWENTANQVEINPLGFQKKYKNFRQALLKNFPYVIMYEIDKSSIIVYSVIHTSRKTKLRFNK